MASKRTALKAVQVISVVAGMIFFFTPLGTAAQAILCFGAFFVFVICGALSGGLDEKNTGFWPDPPNNQ